MIIQAGEYELRSVRQNDVREFYNLAHDEMVREYVFYAYPKNIKEASEMVKYYSNCDCKNAFYLFIQKDKKIIGMIIAVRTIGKILETSAFISKEFRGNGIMTTSMKSFIKWLSENTDYEKLEMYIDQKNIISNSQIKKIGGVFNRIRDSNNIYEVKLR